MDLISRAAAPYIAPACYDTDLVSGIMKLFYLGGNACDHRFIIQLDSTFGIAHGAVVFARQRFPGELQDYSAHNFLVLYLAFIW